MTKLTIYLLITALSSYLVGGLNGAIIASLNFFKKDVRKFGSGNAGLTNYTRTFGTGTVLLVIAVDVLKAVVCILAGGWLVGLAGYPNVGRLFAGFCVEIGHVYPVYYRFQGGKAVLCGGVLALMIDWRVGLICWTVFIVLVVFTKYVSLGSILGCSCMPLALLIFNHSGLEAILGLLCALVIIISHRENIVRLIKGQESKLSIGNNSRPRN